MPFTIPRIRAKYEEDSIVSNVNKQLSGRPWSSTNTANADRLVDLYVKRLVKWDFQN